MVNSEVQKGLESGAQEALKIPLAYEEFGQLCLRTYILTAVKLCDGNQRRAAMKIGVTETHVSNAVHGKTLMVRRSSRRKKKEPETASPEVK